MDDFSMLNEQDSDFLSSGMILSRFEIVDWQCF